MFPLMFSLVLPLFAEESVLEVPCKVSDALQFVFYAVLDSLDDWLLGEFLVQNQDVPVLVVGLETSIVPVFNEVQT